MGIIKKIRGAKQEESVEAPQVWIEDPKGTGQLILVKKTDLDERGFLIDDEEDEGDAVA